jgi:glucokinase
LPRQQGEEFIAALSRRKDRRVLIAERNVMRELHAGGPRTLDEISSSLKRRRLPAGNVRDWLRGLEDDGRIFRGNAMDVGLADPPPDLRKGRPPMYATLSDRWGYGVGIEIARSWIRAAVMAPSGRVLSHAERDRPGSHRLEDTLEVAVDAVREAVDGLAVDERERLVGIAVAVAAPVDRKLGTVARDMQRGWGSEPIQDSFNAWLPNDLPTVAVINDANARAIGEARFGLARAKHSAFVLKVSGGIGGALLRRGRLIDGYSGFAGELGHLRVAPELLTAPLGPSELDPLKPDAQCGCGDLGGQHLEAYASTEAIARRVSGARGADVEFDEIAKNWRFGADSRRAVEDASRLLGQAIASVVVLFDPAIIVVTGRFAKCGQKALKPLETAVEAVRPTRDPPPVVIHGSQDGVPETQGYEWIGVRGAARFAIESKTSADDPPAAGDQLAVA